MSTTPYHYDCDDEVEEGADAMEQDAGQEAKEYEYDLPPPLTPVPKATPTQKTQAGLSRPRNPSSFPFSVPLPQPQPTKLTKATTKFLKDYAANQSRDPITGALSFNQPILQPSQSSTPARTRSPQKRKKTDTGAHKSDIINCLASMEEKMEWTMNAIDKVGAFMESLKEEMQSMNEH